MRQSVAVVHAAQQVQAMVKAKVAMEMVEVGRFTGGGRCRRDAAERSKIVHAVCAVAWHVHWVSRGVVAVAHGGGGGVGGC